MKKGYLALASLALLVILPGCKDKEKVKPRHIPRRPTAVKHEAAPRHTETPKEHNGTNHRNRIIEQKEAKLAAADTPVMHAAATMVQTAPAKKVTRHTLKKDKVVKHVKAKKEKIKKEKTVKQPKTKKVKVKKEKAVKQPKAKKHEKTAVLAAANTPVAKAVQTTTTASRYERTKKMHKIRKEKDAQKQKAAKVKKQKAKKERVGKEDKKQKPADTKKQKHGKKHEKNVKLASIDTPVTTAVAAPAIKDAPKHIKKHHAVKKEKIKKEKKVKVKKEKAAKQPKVKKEKKHKAKKHEAPAKTVLAMADITPAEEVPAQEFTAAVTEVAPAVEAPETMPLVETLEQAAPATSAPALETPAIEEASLLTEQPEETEIAIEEEEDLIPDTTVEMSAPAVAPAVQKPIRMIK